MKQTPTQLQLAPDGQLIITWTDGQIRSYTPDELYAHNPAADARAERQQASEQPAANPLALNVIAAEETQARKIVGMQAVGNYAYQIEFNYGSNSGIYQFELLRSLGTPLE